MPNCSESDCDRPSVTRGMCRKHYQRAREKGVIPMTGAERQKNRKGGRPLGAVASAPLPEGWTEGQRSEAEVKQLALNRLYAILANEETPRDETLKAAAIAARFEADGGDEEKRKKAKELFSAVRGEKDA